MKQSKSKSPKRIQEAKSESPTVSNAPGTNSDGGQAAHHFDTAAESQSSNTNTENSQAFLGNDLQTDSRPKAGI